MLLTPHTIAGVAIGACTQNPFIAFPTAVAMHFVGDLVPHWDFFSNTPREDRIHGWRPLAVMADLVLGVALGLTLTLYALWVLKNNQMALSIFVGGIGGVLPDALEGPHIYMKEEPKWVKPISKLQSRLQFQAPLPWGLLSQALVILFSSLIIANSLAL